MQTIIVAIILISALVLICLALVSVNNKHRRRRTAALLANFSKAGTENNLSFSAQEILNNCALGLDGIHRKLLVLKKINETNYNSFVIDLNDVNACSKKNIYKTVNMGGSKVPKLENHLEKIALKFEFTDGRQPIEIPFYSYVDNHALEIEELGQKVKNWEIIISQILKKNVKKIA